MLKDVSEPVAADLCCLDAHANLGNLIFDSWAKETIRHYEVGLRIGEFSLGADFDGLLPWSHIDNRPFLRCMHGFGLRLWRFERFDEAERVCERMLWLNPSDNQGVRFLIGAVMASNIESLTTAPLVSELPPRLPRGGLNAPCRPGNTGAGAV